MMKDKRFPQLNHQRIDENPAIQIFGRRFYKDQTEIEYLAEFLLVFLSPKFITNPDQSFSIGFPSDEDLNTWPVDTTLKYKPHEHLPLKLFSFLTSSKLETRHACHKKRFEQIISKLKTEIETDYNMSEEQVINLLEQLLSGFVGVSANRTWCTQVFLPVSKGLIAAETMWKRIQGNNNPHIFWEDSINQGYFTFTNHDFMARGGEVLYLQLCNLKRFLDSSEITNFERENKFKPGSARQALEDITDNLIKLFEETAPISKLTKWIEDADPETQNLIQRHDASCGWVPEESWPEAYLFANEFANICKAAIDPLEKIEMLTFCCVLQVLRSICSQAVRYGTVMTDKLKKMGGCNGFIWLITPPSLDDQVLKETAKQNLMRVQEIIFSSLKYPGILPPSPNTKGRIKNYDKEADKHSQELFIHLGKRIGFIAPRTGPGARFIISEKILRYLVLALIPPGSKMTLKSFTDRMFCHYGMAVAGTKLKRAIRWTFPRQQLQSAEPQKQWLENSLKATGFLIPLSDAVSQIQNPFNQNKI